MSHAEDNDVVCSNSVDQAVSSLAAGSEVELSDFVGEPFIFDGERTTIRIVL
jgi:hypothetical protein